MFHSIFMGTFFKVEDGFLGCVWPRTVVKEQEVVHVGASNSPVVVATIEFLSLALWNAVHDRADLLALYQVADEIADEIAKVLGDAQANERLDPDELESKDNEELVEVHIV